MYCLPPGPRFTITMLINFLLDPLSYYARCARRYGDPFTLPTSFGKLVVTGKPDGIRAIYTARHEILEIFASSIAEPFLGAASLMLTYGEQHRKNRKIVAPLFHGKQVWRYGELMAARAARAAANWRVGESFIAQEAMTDITADIFLHVLFGDSAKDVNRLAEAFRETENATRPSIVYVPFLRRDFGGLGPWAKFRRKMRRLDAIFYDLIARRRSQPPGEDVLSMLLATRYEDGSTMDDVEVRDQLLSLVAAGHETLASALSWALYWLHWEPVVLDHLLAEIDRLGANPQPQEISALPYLTAVCCETLRRNPILPEVSRRLRQPLEIRGYTLPAGVAVSPMASLVHMDEQVYEKPWLFRPERFLERQYSAFEFVPFGGGTHRCVGGTFAMYEMQIVLATLLTRFRFHLESKEPVRPRRRNFPFGPLDAVKLVVEGRRQPGLNPS